ncbi:AraC family transcriptional regulator [Aeromicrobium sp. CF4.19]|uniref:AraC family transcriptional regulator n=1 Tax=Aeromicrobium sp. CF4.19 TaxID=3373082 RepID=UPI003EE7ACD8
MTSARPTRHREMLRVRDAIDARYGEPLDLATLATSVHLSPDHLVRQFRETFGETPHRYLQRRRIERLSHDEERSDEGAAERGAPAPSTPEREAERARPLHHRGLPAGRLHEPRDVQPDLREHRG